MYLRTLQKAVQDKNLMRMYPLDGRQLHDIANSISGQIDQLCAAWRLPLEVGIDFVKLALFDVILYVGGSPTAQLDTTAVTDQVAKVEPSR